MLSVGIRHSLVKTVFSAFAASASAGAALAAVAAAVANAGTVADVISFSSSSEMELLNKPRTSSVAAVAGFVADVSFGGGRGGGSGGDSRVDAFLSLITVSNFFARVGFGGTVGVCVFSPESG